MVANRLLNKLAKWEKNARVAYMMFALNFAFITQLAFINEAFIVAFGPKGDYEASSYLGRLIKVWVAATCSPPLRLMPALFRSFSPLFS